MAARGNFTPPIDEAETELGAIELKDAAVSRPTKSKYRDQLTETETFKRVTFHEVSQLVEQTPTETRTYFFKKNDPGSHLSELEAAYAEFYRFLAPAYIAETFALEDKASGKYLGVISEKFPEFKSTAVDPLTEDDLQTDFITTKHLSFDLLDALDEEYTELKKLLAQTKRKLKRVNELAAFHDAQSEKHCANPGAFSETEIEALSTEAEANLIEKIKLIKEKKHVTKNLRNFHTKLTETHKITEREFEKYRIIKGTAIALTTSYIYDEDDMHRNNWTKFGIRIDFDMSGWPISYHYKKEALDKYYGTALESKFLDLRQPTADAFKVTAKDLIHFPCLEDAQPSYWPTTRAITNSIHAALNVVFPVSTNPYPPAANVLYQQLKTNPVFRYHYFFVLAKFILCNESIYKQLALMHIREDSAYKPEGKLLHGKTVERILKKMAEFVKLLTNMREFCEFFKAHQDKIITQLLKDIKKSGISVPKEMLTATCAKVIVDVNTTLERQPATPPLAPVAPPVEIKAVPLTPAEALIKIKAAIKAEMGGYTGSYFSMFTRNHHAFATKLTTESEEQKPDTKDAEGNLTAIAKLKAIITTELTRTQIAPSSTTAVKIHQEGQGMHTALSKLLKQIDDMKIAPTKQLDAPSRLTVS